MGVNCVFVLNLITLGVGQFGSDLNLLGNGYVGNCCFCVVDLYCRIIDNVIYPIREFIDILIVHAKSEQCIA